jgi:DNA-binding transcriptional ArsR family regulator
MYKYSIGAPMRESLRRYKAAFFQALAHPTRVAIIEILRDGEVSVGQLCEQLGVEQANVSQHLSILKSKNIVVSRKEANQAFYSLRDPMLRQVLDNLRDYFHAHLKEAMEVLSNISEENKQS